MPSALIKRAVVSLTREQPESLPFPFPFPFRLVCSLLFVRFLWLAWSHVIRPFPNNGCVCIDALMAGMDVSHGSMRVMIDLLSVFRLQSKIRFVIVFHVVGSRVGVRAPTTLSGDSEHREIILTTFAFWCGLNNSYIYYRCILIFTFYYRCILIFTFYRVRCRHVAKNILLRRFLVLPQLILLALPSLMVRDPIP